MPYIETALSQPLDHAHKETLKSALGELISIIPGKSESVLMIHIKDQAELFFAGEKDEPMAYMVIKLFKESAFEHKAAFTEKVFALMEQEFGVSGDNFFLNIETHECWGYGGTLKK